LNNLITAAAIKSLITQVETLKRQIDKLVEQLKKLKII